MVRDIRLLDIAKGEKNMFASEAVSGARVKLERSLASRRNIAKGEMISESDLHLLSPGDGFKWSEMSALINKVANQDIPANEIIYKI